MIIQKSLLVRLGLCVGLVAALAACGEDEDDSATVALPKKDKAAAAPAAEAARPVDDNYTYNAVNRRDPFRSYLDELQVTEEQTGDTSKLTKLQKLDLDKLRLVTVVVGTATPMAMVEDPDGVGHTIRVGTLVGKHFGQVKYIRRGEVVIQEEFRDFTQKRVAQLRTLRLDDSAPPSTP
jgi:type IV pilus assembly protein PilP